MASSCEASCISDPNFAVICAFLERFATSCGIEFPTFVDLQEMLENVDQVPQELIDLHIKLLRKARKTVFIEKWERALIKFCHTYSSQDGWEIERFGYKKSRLEVKIRVLKMLLEGQFDLNQKFKAQINTLESGELRTKPLGKDKLGRLYWLQTDSISNIRVYREDMDEESWTLVAKDRPSLVELLQELSGEDSPLDLNLLNEDTASLDMDKPAVDTGQNEKEDIQDKDEEDDEEVQVNGKANDNSQEQPVNGVATKEEVNNRLYEGAEVGEAIEEPIMYITGEGAGADCEAANPDKEEEQSEHVESSASNTLEQDLPSEKQKLTPKLWSIDTICGVNIAEVNEVKHKNFSSFSIDSVLEKKDSDATFSKYIVNCPFESNSVGGEQVSDANLKTEVNNDALPYWEVSGGESSVCTSSKDVTNSIKLIKDTSSDEYPSMVVPSSKVPCECNKSDSEINETLEDNNHETARSDVQETLSKTESPVFKKLEDTVLKENVLNIQTDIISSADKLENDEVKNQAEEIIKSSLESKIKPSGKESFIMKEIKADHLIQGDFKNNAETVSKPVLEQKLVMTEIKDILPEEEKKATIELPKSVAEKVESDKLFSSEIVEEEKEKTELPESCQTGKENQCETTVEEMSSTEMVAETVVVLEKSKVDKIKVFEKVDLKEQDITPEKLDQIEKIDETYKTKSLEILKEEFESKEIKSEKKSEIEEAEILKKENEENSLKKEFEKESQEKVECVTPVKTNIKEKEVSKISEVELSEPMEVDPIVEEKSPAEDEFEKINEKILESTGEKIESNDKNQKEEELGKKIEGPDDKKLELIEKDTDTEAKVQTYITAEETGREPEVVEVETKELENPEKSIIYHHETEVDKEKSSEENIQKEDESEIVVETESRDQNKMDKSDVTEKQIKENEENTDIAEVNSNVKHKEEKKLKRELVVAIEKIDSAPDDIQEDQKETETEKDNEDKLAPRKLTRSSTKPKESEGEKDVEKETKKKEPEEMDDFEKEKKGVRRLSRSRRGIEENPKAEEISKMTRGLRKSVEMDETPKQMKGRRGKRKIKEKENDVEMEVEEKAHVLKDDNEKSEEKDNENEKDIEKEKPQPRRVGRKPKNRRRRFFNFAKTKVQEDDEQSKKNEEVERVNKSEENQEKKEKKRRRKRDEATILRERAAQELKLLGITEDTEIPTIRQSRRIAQIKLKEEAERRRLEALQLESFKKEKEKKGKKKKKSKFDSDSGDEEKNDKDFEDSEDELPKKERRRRRRKKDKLKFNELNPWLSSSGSSTVDEEEEDLEDEPHEDEELVFKSDHEFSPESDVEDPDYKPIKRARTAKVEESEEKGGKYDDTACEKCGNKDHPEWILLCDKCDKGWHASCVRPALMVIPEGDWFCPPCEHGSLVEKLKQSLAQYDRSKKQRENEELRRKRLAFVGISLDNVLPPTKKAIKEENDEKFDSESSSESESPESNDSSNSSEPVYQLRERRANVTSYRYNEYDELIKSALKDEIEAVKGAGNAGRGKDINNIVNAEKQKENENSEEEGREIFRKEIICNQVEKTKEKSKKEDEDYDVDTEEEDEDENVEDEIPPVVPKNVGLKKKRSKSVKITSLDFTSEEEDNNSDSDFKGISDEEESECSLPSESESSDEIGRRKRGYDGPVRRSTRARVSRYDRNFINDDSEDDEPKRKRCRSWDSSESSDSDRSWGRKKRKKGGSTGKIRKFSNEKKKKKKQKKRAFNSEDDEDERPVKKSKSRKIIYGGLDEEPILSRRTRGKKINYQEMNGSDSEDDLPVKTSRVIESDDDFVAENDKDEEAQNAESEEMESDVDEEEDTDAEKEKKPTEKKKKILEGIKKKKWDILDPSYFSENELLEEKHLEQLNEELEDLDEEEEEILGNILEKGDIPISELRNAVKRAKEERRKTKESGTEKSQTESLARTFPPIPAHMEFGGGKFPKIGKVKITPSRAELASMKGLPPQSLPGPGAQSGFNATTGFLTPENQEDKSEFLLRTLPGEKGLGDPNIPANHSKPAEQRPYPYQMEAPPPAGPLTMMAMMNSQQGDGTSIGAKDEPPQYPFQGMTGYPPNIPTTVMGISDIEAQGKKKPGPKPGTKIKKKVNDGDDNAASGDEFKMESVKMGRGRGRKPEGEAVSTVQPPTQFPPADGGSVITRMLNAPQYESNQFALRNPPFRHIHFASTSRPPPPIRARVPGPMFHTSHPQDPSPSGGGPINISTTKPSPPSPTFNRAPVPIMQRFPDPRFTVQGSPSRPEFSTYGNYYGNYPLPDEAGFQNPPSYPEQFAEGAPPPPKPFEDETGGEFGGLASYFASQREEDLDT